MGPKPVVRIVIIELGSSLMTGYLKENKFSVDRGAGSYF